MAVSRLDSTALTTGQAATGEGATPYIGPVNGIVGILVAGTFTGLTLAIEVFDGTNWTAINGLSAISVAGAYSWQGAALGIRSNVTAISTGAVTVTVVLSDFS